MVDLETLGTVPGCAILSIGAVEFHPETGKLGKEFYVVVNRESCVMAMLSVSDDTLAWWTRQNEEARKVLEHSANKKTSVPLQLALTQFNAYLRTVGGVKETSVYGNGADFDNPILAVAYDCAKVKSGIGSYQGRCYRTLKNLHELFGDGFAAHKADRGGTYHNALDDAKTQAVHLMEVVANIKKSTARIISTSKR